jgi:hypothetical protein
MLHPDEVLQQSKAAFGQWEGQWREHARINGKKYKEDGRSQQDLIYIGAGKTLVCAANGSSLEDHIDTIKKYKNDSVDIICCDKTFGVLLKQGIKPNYVVVADANVGYKEWLEPWIDETRDVILFASICANPEWTLNWKGPVYFYVNKDNIESEKIFSEISGCHEFIPASSNVGNTVVVFSVQILGYDEYLLIGYDFAWGDSDNYYAFDDRETPTIKRHWMKHAHGVDMRGEVVNTSQNLIFSSRWLSDYFIGMTQQMNIRLYYCSGRGILNMATANFERKLKAAKQRQLTNDEQNLIIKKHIKQQVITPQMGNAALNEALKRKVTEIIVKYIPESIGEIRC